MRYARIGLVCLTVVFLQVLKPPQLSAQQGDPEVLLQQAIHAEQVNGDLDQAISLFRQLVEQHGSERPVAAQALLRLGLCYERLGREEAINAYERLVADYGDQSEIVTEARARLAVLRAEVAAETNDGLVARRLLEDDGCAVTFMRPSPDGTRLAYTDLCTTLAVHVRDVASGSVVQLTNEATHYGIAWSSDGSRIATAELHPRQQLKIIDVETGSIEEVQHLAGAIYLPDDWSSYGEFLSCKVTNDDQVRSTVVLSLSSGDQFTLAPRTGQHLDRAEFSPDGRYVTFTDFTGENQDIYVLNMATRERARVTTTPEAEYGATWSPDGTTLVYHNSRGTWAVRVTEGSVEGNPWLVRSVPYGMPEASTTWTANGYYYASANTTTHPYRIPFDSATARTLGPPELLTEAMPGLNWRTSYAWSPDMERVASTGGEDQQYIHVARGQSVRSFHLGEETVVWSMWWSGDGSEIVYTTRRNSQREVRRTVYALDPTSGDIRELFPAVDSISHVHVSADGSRMVFQRPFDISREDAVTPIADLVVSDLGASANGLVLASSSHAEGWIARQITQPAFSPDASMVSFFRIHEIGAGHNDFESSLWIVPSDGSEPARELVRANQIPVAYWHPGGRWIVFNELRGTDPENFEGGISAISIETGEKVEVLGKSDLEAIGIPGLSLRALSPDGRWLGAAATTGGFEYWVVDDPLAEREGEGR